MKGTINRLNIYPDPTHTWRVTGTVDQLPLGGLVLVSVPGGKFGARGSRYIEVKEHSDRFVDRSTGREMVTVYGPRKPHEGYVRARDKRSATEAHLSSTRGLCESCGRKARLVETEDGPACRPCARGEG